MIVQILLLIVLALALYACWINLTTTKPFDKVSDKTVDRFFKLTLKFFVSLFLTLLMFFVLYALIAFVAKLLV